MHDRTSQSPPPTDPQAFLPDSLPPDFDLPRFLADYGAAAEAARARALRIDDDRPLPRYEGTWRVALGTQGGF